MQTTKLPPSDLLENCSTISFNPKYKDCWQTVYFSQLYGTLFVVYGKFDFDEKENYLKADFKTINYKGTINLGIKEASTHPHKLRRRIRIEENTIPIKTKHVNIIPIKLKIAPLLIENFDDRPNENHLFGTSSKKDRDIRYLLNEEIDLKKDVLYLEIERELCKLPNSKPFQAGIFDQEHYYRDGIRSPNNLEQSAKYWEYFTGKGYSPMVNHQNKLIDALGNVISDPQEPKGPGGICPRGYSLIVI